MDKNQIVTNQELIISNMLEINALIRILRRKGITDEDEVVKEVEKLKIEMDELVKKMSKEN